MGQIHTEIWPLGLAPIIIFDLVQLQKPSSVSKEFWTYFERMCRCYLNYHGQAEHLFPDCSRANILYSS